jgi:hypothetical protein
MACKTCEQIKDKSLQVYYETPEITVLKINDHLVMGTFKQHLSVNTDSKVSGLIKIMISMLKEHNPNSMFSLRNNDECPDHLVVYATVINKKKI